MSSDSASTPKIQYQVPAEYSVKVAWLMRVLADKNLSEGAKVVATRLMHYHNDKTGTCNPRQGILADAIGIGRQKVNEWIAELAASGWITPHRIKGSGSLYRLEVGRMVSASVRKRAKRAQPAGRKLSPVPDNGLSPVSDNGCPTLATTVVASAGQGVVAAIGHRTTKGNCLLNGPENDQLQPQSTATVIPLHQPSSGRDATQEDQPKFIVIGGVQIPTDTMAEWTREFQFIQVRPAIVGLASWMRDNRVPEDRHIAVLASRLSRKNEDAERNDRRDRIEAEAKARHAVAKEKPRPAI
ncbi:hypothetical protein MFUR16E_18595 [Methylobacterium fujisawaense]|uniref:helix-turn-helix domain-containing protein n=1 Tax=Methylobacterium fujisawaense TaxID=107400 RepID=UPI002F323AA8